MRKLILLLALLLTFIAPAQIVKMQVQGEKGITSTQRDGLTVPSGEFWKIYNTTTSQWEYWDGDSWEPLISGVTEVNDLSSSVTWATVPDAYISESSVTQHEAALTITESQISDLTHTTSLTPNNVQSRLLENSSVSGSYNLDYSAYETWYLTLTGDTTFTQSNLPTSGTYTSVKTIHLTGDYALTFPTGWSDNINGTYVGTVFNTIVVEYIKSGVYKVSIIQED